MRQIIGNPSFVDDGSVITYINIIAQKHNLPTIGNLKERGNVINALDNIIQGNPVAKELAQWQAFQTRLNQFFPVIALMGEAKHLDTAFNNLKKDETKITQLILSHLYEVGIQTLENTKKFDCCPLCDRPFQGNLLEHLTNKHQELSELHQLKEAYENKNKIVLQRLEAAQKKAAVIQSEPSDVILASFSSFFTDIKEIVADTPPLIAEIKKPLRDISNLSLSQSPAVANIDRISQQEMSMKLKAQDHIKKLSEDENTKSLATDYNAIIQLGANYIDFAKASSKATYLSNIVMNIGQLLNDITDHIQNSIQTIFTAIQSNVVDYFSLLEDGNPYLKHPQISLVTGKDKAIELEIEFVSEKITPAYKFMSESQVNSFGLAIFLAVVRHFNSQFPFIILDDIVNSFDAFKRPKVSQLLAKKFPDFQILLLTHDQVFFDTVQRDFPNWNRYKFTGWDYTTGPKVKLALNYLEEIQDNLDDDKPIAAGVTLGRYLEWTFGLLNEAMQSPIRYKIDGVYTLPELYDPLIKRLKDKLKLAGKQHRLLTLFDTFEQATIFRNYCAHWKNEANPFTTPEIEAILKKWIEIQQLTFCNICKSSVQLEKAGNVEYIKCDCGTLDLKAPSYYS